MIIIFCNSGLDLFLVLGLKGKRELKYSEYLKNDNSIWHFLLEFLNVKLQIFSFACFSKNLSIGYTASGSGFNSRVLCVYIIHYSV